MTKILKFQYAAGYAASYCRIDADASILRSLASSHNTCGKVIDDLSINGKAVGGGIVKISSLNKNQYCTGGYIFDC